MVRVDEDGNPLRHRPRCFNRMCGADDCENCHPEAYSEIACPECGKMTTALELDWHGDTCEECESKTRGMI